MQRLTLDRPISDALKGAIVALGNFDGFHLGHQAVVGRAIQKAAHERRAAIVATFDPHPVRFFKPDLPPFRLTSLDQRERLFAHAGADAMLVFEFNAELAATSAADFVGTILADRIGAAGVVTGEDFTFGRGREGTAITLQALSAEHGMSAEAVGPISLESQVISSSRVRDALQAGDPGTATHLLTRPFAIEGEVIHGDKRGRDLGWPTANMELGRYLRPKYGIYAVRVRLPDGSEHGGVASLGTRPMFDPPQELLETFVFDFDGDLYGQTIEVDLIAYLRPELKLDGIEALKAQMAKDEAAARNLVMPSSRP